MMASESDRHPADDTVVVDADERAARAGDWPVADLYLIEAEASPDGASGDDTVVLEAQPAPATPRRRLPATGAALLAVAALVVGAGVLAAVLLAAQESSQPARGATSPPSPATPPPATEATSPSSPVTSPPENTTTSRTATAVSVPSVVGLSASDAVAALRRAGFETRIRVVASTRRAGIVLTQSPAGAEGATRGSTVRLKVSKPRPVPQKVAVPDLVGLDAGEARRRLRSLGLGVDVVRVTSAQPSGTVLRQSPRAGVRVAEQDRVGLTVSSGPEAIDVPDVTGLDEASARAELESAGFEVTVTYEPTTDPALDGLVDRQTPAGGTTATGGSVATIVVMQLG